MSSTDFSLRSTSPNTGRLGPGDDRPLTDQEQRLVQRLFSDPFSFPLAFKAWLVSYLETSDMLLPMSSVSGLQSTLGITGAGSGILGTLPAGLIFPYGGTTAPTGAAMCDGAAYSTSTESRLFAAIGYLYGGSGATFNVPDLRGRVAVGKGTNAAVDTPGKTEVGVALGDRRPHHRHTTSASASVTDPGHSHTAARSGQPSGAGAGAGNNVQDATTSPATTGITVGVSVSVGSSGSDPLDAPAFAVVNFIIVK